MKESKDTIEVLLIVFITLKIVNFNNMQVLDYILLVIVAVYIILELVERIRKGIENGKRKR